MANFEKTRYSFMCAEMDCLFFNSCTFNRLEAVIVQFCSTSVHGSLELRSQFNESSMKVVVLSDLGIFEVHLIIIE